VLVVKGDKGDKSRISSRVIPIEGFYKQKRYSNNKELIKVVVSREGLYIVGRKCTRIDT